MAKNFHSRPFDEGTLTKLDLFGNYMGEWLPVWVSQAESGVPITIVDFFAGPGRDSKGMLGSPLIALAQVRKLAGLIREKRATIRLELNELATDKAAVGDWRSSPMAQSRSRIEWTEMTWNPTTGCSKISPGCTHCYAETMARRLRAMGLKKYANGFSLTLHESALEAPLAWKTPRTVFVNSMSDLFHRNVPDEFILRVFDIMARCPQHRFQVLTKRADRLQDLDTKLHWPCNVWMGVSVEDARRTPRIECLRQTRAAVKFLSLEPLIGPLPALNLDRIDWVIAGGESGPGARPMATAWVLDIRDQCLSAGVPFFFKQWGGVNKKKTGRSLDGRTYDGMPHKAS